MDNHKTARYAIVRGVPDTYDNCIKTHNDKIDVELAREQHRAYCRALQALGLQLVIMDPDDSFPDCCFVEDTAIIIGDTAVITRMGAPSRALETGAVKTTIANYKKVREILSPACVDGGDVLKIDSKLFVGLSQRTNRQALEQLKDFIPEESGYELIPVGISNILHLKTTCTFLGKGCLIYLPATLTTGLSPHTKKSSSRRRKPTVQTA